MNISPEASQTAEWLEGSSNTPHNRFCVIDVIHDGDQLQVPSPVAARNDIREAFKSLRGHGTRAFAQDLCDALGASGVISLRVARVTLDLDKLPGVDIESRNRALGSPVAPLLSADARRALMQTYRLGMVTLAEARRGAPFWISVMPRPDQKETLRLRWSVTSISSPNLDPLVPAQVLNSVCDISIIEDLLMHLGSDADPAADHEPLAPSSLAARAIAFNWMIYLQEKLEQYGPARNEIWDEASRSLWSALLDTSGLSAETHAIRSFLDHHLEPAALYRKHFHAIAARHQRAQLWLSGQIESLVADYQIWPKRRQGLVIEIPPHLSSDTRVRWAQKVAHGLRTRLTLQAKGKSIE